MKISQINNKFRDADTNTSHNNEKFKIKVCMITPLFPPDYAGGSKQALTLCKELRKKAINIFVIAGCVDDVNMVKKANMEGIETFRICRHKKDGFFNMLSYGLRILFILIKQRSDYDVIHVHGIRYYIFIALIPAKIFGKKIIAKMSLVGSDDPFSIKKRPFGFLQLRLISHADKIISISSELSHRYRKSQLPIEKLVEISNGVDTEKFRPLSISKKSQLRDKLGLPKDKIIVSFIGIIDYRKGVDLLASAWELVSQNYKNCHLLLVGPKTKEEAEVVDEKFVHMVEKRFANARLTNITFTGFVPNVEEYLQTSDIFVLPSRREGLPNTLLEAMSCGLACIATKLPWGEDIIEHGKDGFLMGRDDSKNLSELICLLTKDSKLRKNIGKNARKKILNDFSANVVASKYELVYKDLIE